MAAPVEVFGRELRFGLFFIYSLQKELKVDNTQQVADKLAEDVFVNFPIALQVANNTKKNSKKIDFEQACDIIDEYGGMKSKHIEKFSEELFNSLGISKEDFEEAEEQKEKPKPSKKK